MSTQKTTPVHHSCEGFVRLDADDSPKCMNQSLARRMEVEHKHLKYYKMRMKAKYVSKKKASFTNVCHNETPVSPRLISTLYRGGCFTGKSWSTNMFSALIYARAEQGMVSKCFCWRNDPSGSTT